MDQLDHELRERFPLIVGAVSVAITVARYGPLVWRAVKHMVAFCRALEAIAGLPAQVDALVKEIRPNGGSSLRDAIDRTACAVEDLAIRHQTRWTMAYGIPSWESDAAGRCVRANRELCELLKVSEDEIVGSNWKNCIHPEDTARVYSEWSRIVAEHADYNLTARYVSASGEVIPVRIRAHVMVRDGKPIGWIGTAERTT